MYTFLFIGHSEEKLSKGVLQNFARITKKWMPALGVDLNAGYTIFPDLRTGWFWLAPMAHRDCSLISEAIDERYALIVFGDIFSNDEKNAAQIVLEAWITGGAPRVRNLEGCFSTVIIDRRSGETALIGDVTGRRRLNYYQAGETLVVSPHDFTLTSTGLVPIEFDLTSVCSVVGIEWSLGGKSILKNVQSCHPAEYLCWNNGHMKRISDPVVQTSERLSRQDLYGISVNLNEMIQVARDQARIFLDNTSEIRCDLSAGIDSRVVWSLLLSVIDDPSRILSISGGEGHCLDVRVARRLAAMYGTGFLSQMEIPPSPDEFLGRCDLLAFSMNGGTPGKRAIKSPTKFTPHPQTYACGNGGEIYRGYYYLHPSLGDRPHLFSKDALGIIQKKSRIDRLPWKTPDLHEGVCKRLTERVEDYANISEDGFDVLDMFYLYERMGVWGSSTARQTWKDPRWSPFMSPQMIRMAFRMPAPIARFATIHSESLRRFVPRAYWIRINDTELLPLENWAPISPVLKAFDKTARQNLARGRRFLNRFRSQQKTKDMDQLAADTVSGLLMRTISDVLLSDKSFALEIFGQSGMERLLGEQKQQQKDHTEVLGLLVAMERWRGMIQNVTQESRA